MYSVFVDGCIHPIFFSSTQWPFSSKLPNTSIRPEYLFKNTVQLVDAVSSAFSQICVHLSEPLFDMVLNMVFDYASTNVRTNAVRAIHQLVECVANADPIKTLAKFLPFCARNIEVELDHGASSVRSTSLKSTPLPSDATLHWSEYVFLGLTSTG